MSVEKKVVTASGPKIKISIIKCGGDGRKDAYRYLAQLIVNKMKKS